LKKTLKSFVQEKSRLRVHSNPSRVIFRRLSLAEVSGMARAVKRIFTGDCVDVYRGGQLSVFLLWLRAHTILTVSTVDSTNGSRW
jgi:hypothetical protein